MIVWSQKYISTNFRMVMRNQLWDFPLICSKKYLLVHFIWLCEIFAWSCEMEIHNFSTFFCHFFHFFLLNPLQSPPNQFQIPVQTNYITFVIMHLDLHQLYLFSSIWLISFVTNLWNHTLKWVQNFIKLVSNSCKGNNMLIECFRHNYYSKDVKLMKIII